MSLGVPSTLGNEVYDEYEGHEADLLLFRQLVLPYAPPFSHYFSDYMESYSLGSVPGHSHYRVGFRHSDGTVSLTFEKGLLGSELVWEGKPPYSGLKLELDLIRQEMDAARDAFQRAIQIPRRTRVLNFLLRRS